jgi:large subunit ribosomal protein LX
MSEYTVRGRFRSRGGWSNFEKAADAPNEDVARERVYTRLGSEQGVKRPLVEIDEVEA